MKPDNFTTVELSVYMDFRNVLDIRLCPVAVGYLAAFHYPILTVKKPENETGYFYYS